MASQDDLGIRLRSLAVLDGDIPDFDSDNVPEHPAELFLDWLLEAIDSAVREPHAMTLSTIDENGRPNARVLILKGLDDGRWQFATSRASRKGEELADSPWAAATFYWPEQGRQVRLRGAVVDGGDEDAARDFLARPEASRVESLAGNQSRPLSSPDDLESALEEARTRLASDPELVPDHWGLFHLVPDEVEFWQADRNRRHVRLRYELENGRWSHGRLWP